ncbi:hypothetical protein BS78_05G251800 [Paspalum vaginatum]|nr:hypothetical protein BS78_05G251800 [Paspalum vaginatum]
MLASFAINAHTTIILLTIHVGGHPLPQQPKVQLFVSSVDPCLQKLQIPRMQELGIYHIVTFIRLKMLEYLDTGSPKEREHAVVILLAICSRSAGDCLLVMKEGVIPALVDLSVNGTDEAKGCTMKLLNLLRDMRRSDQFSNSCSQEMVATNAAEDAPDNSVHKQPMSKSSRFFQRIFSKPRSLTLF